jgi:hypothetical protein
MGFRSAQKRLQGARLRYGLVAGRCRRTQGREVGPELAAVDSRGTGDGRLLGLELGQGARDVAQGDVLVTGLFHLAQRVVRRSGDGAGIGKAAGVGQDGLLLEECPGPTEVSPQRPQ